MLIQSRMPMAASKTWPRPLPKSKENSPILKRLHLVVHEYLKENPEANQSRFAEAVGISQGALSHTLKGDPGYPVGKKIINGVCLKLGYSAEWFLNGTGDKKAAKTNTLVEIQMLRAEIAVMRNELERLKADVRILSGKKEQFTG